MTVPEDKLGDAAGEAMPYDLHDLDSMEAGRNYYAWIMDQFRPYIGKRVIEVGAGTGTFSRMILGLNVDWLLAIEPSPNLFNVLTDAISSHTNARAFAGEFRDALPLLGEQPDTVFYVNVLEHIRDDDEEVRSVLQVLAPGGHLCVFVPALQWLFGTNDVAVGHYRRYEKARLTALLETAGFRVIKCIYLDILGIIPWFLLFRILKRPAVKRGQVGLYDRLVVPVARRVENMVRVPLGKNLLAVGSKRVCEASQLSG